LVLLLACETLLPTIGFLPVTMQTRDMAVSVSTKTSILARKRPMLKHTGRPRIAHVESRCSARPEAVRCVKWRLLTADYSVIKALAPVPGNVRGP
jgi:hypothetical protein